MTKRSDYISWNKYVIEIDLLTAKRSKDPSTQIGSCIIDGKNKIIGIGYNGFPNGCNDDGYDWSRENKYLYVCHAEQNGLRNSNNFDKIRGSTLYTTLFPCNECTKMIIQLGVKKIIYLNDKYSNTKEVIASKKMLNSANISYTQESTE